MIDNQQLPPSSTHPHGWGPFIVEVATPDERTYGEQLKALEPPDEPCPRCGYKATCPDCNPEGW